ncbi:MAG: ABC transporter ATP-binding protein [Bacteroidota bacterium]
MIVAQLQKKLSGPQGSLHLNIALHVERGQTIALFGASGAGKTATLRMLAGLMRPDNGHITVDGFIWYNERTKTHLKPQKRTIGFMFQEYALFPHMTVLQHLQFAQKKDNPRFIHTLLEVMELEVLANKKPTHLSGGQQQRVALARALARQPQILLLDEPLSALDQNMRQHLRTYLKQLQQQLGFTTILVSHDEAEVQALAEKVYVLQNGSIAQKGSPQKVFKAQNICRGTLVEKTILNQTAEVLLKTSEGKVSLSLPMIWVEGYEIGDTITLNLEKEH